jgi:uncharacterized membrane protein YjjP (DUF1212 family)
VGVGEIVATAAVAMGGVRELEGGAGRGVIVADREARAFILGLAGGLHECGVPAHELEPTLERLCVRLNLAVQVMATPTSIMFVFGAPEEQATSLLRVNPGSIDLAREARLRHIAEEVARGRMGLGEAGARIEALRRAPPPYGLAAVLLATAAASGTTAGLVGGGWTEAGAATVLGLLVGLLERILSRKQDSASLLEFAASALGVLVIGALGSLLGGLNVGVALVSGVVTLLPGFAVTTAVHDLAARHLASGVARLGGAGLTLLALCFGAALGTGLSPWGVASAPSVALPWWGQLGSLLLGPFAFAVLLRARLSDAWIVALGWVVAWSGEMLGTELLGANLAGMVGALCLGVVAHLATWVTRRPATLALVPGLMYLVPGIVGFRGVTAFLDGSVALGAQTVFAMFLSAMGLVAGLLVACVLVPVAPSLMGRR